jgi:hypothetical protein
VKRKTFTGAANNEGSMPASNGATALFDAMSVQCRSTAMAGYGSCPVRTTSIALRTSCSSGSVTDLLRVDWRIPGRKEQCVALAERNVELLGEAHQHVPARLRSPVLEETQMARRDFGFGSQIDLSDAPSLAPFTQQCADRPG